MSDITVIKRNEVTINMRRIYKKCTAGRRAAMAIKLLKKHVARNTGNKVYFDSDLNQKIFSKGPSGILGRIRLNIDLCNDLNNPDKQCFKVSLVDVSTFKNLKDAKVEA